VPTSIAGADIVPYPKISIDAVLLNRVIASLTSLDNGRSRPGVSEVEMAR
jgi:hypothetical protein